MQTFKQFWERLPSHEKRDILKRSGVPRSTITHIVLGTRNPGRKTVQRLMQADNRITTKMLWPDW